MAYQSLARKYRPRFFHELVAQDATVLALQNAIRLGREPHGVLFSGIRGVGKTTFARLYAKTLNCLNPQETGPCDECINCVTTSEGRSQDVMEIDGASNTSVDDIRALQETIPYRPHAGKYRIYIIDEVHMLSISAFNALLKSLEEPPSHVVFIFATTEIQKVPATIISRCQVFHLKKISVDQLVKRLKEILAAEKVSYEDQAIMMIALEGQGSMRDSLTLLDQVIALGGGEVKQSLVRSLFSSYSPEELLILLEAIITKNASAIVKQIDIFDQNGVRFSKIVEELAKLTRHASICRELGKEVIEQSLGIEQSLLDGCDRLGKKATALDLAQIFRTLVSCRRDLDGSTIDRFIVENYLLEWCLDPGFERLFAAPTSSGNKKTEEPILAAPEVHSSEPAPGTRATLIASPAAMILPHAGHETHETNEELKAISSSRTPLNQRFKEANALDSTEPQVKGNPLPHHELSDEGLINNQNLKPDNEDITVSEHKSQIVLSHSTAGQAEPSSLVHRTELAEKLRSPEQEENSTLQSAFPATWEELLHQWKRLHPLRARKLEEVYVTKYSPEEIILAVEEKQFAAETLLSRPFQDQLKQEFAAMFQFNGRLYVQVLGEEDALPGFSHPDSPKSLDASVDLAPKGTQISPGEPKVARPESITERKEREKKERRLKIEENARLDPTVQYLLEQFDGKIEKVMISDYPS